MLKKIKIEGLFNKFNYEIELREAGLTILTGPNGYGKTTVLKIIHAVAIKDPEFFFQLPFSEIILTQENAEIRFSKTENDTFEIQVGDEESITFDKKKNIIPSTIDQMLNLDPEFQAKYYKKRMPDFPDAYLIREQRLVREIEGNFSSMIEEYSKGLAGWITVFLKTASEFGQKLDSTFPQRLFEETSKVSEEEFRKRYDAIVEKQKSLNRYGLFDIGENPHPSFKEENAKALLVYLNDMEEKLSFFDPLLQRLEVFSSILNEKQFAFKQIEISPDFGFRFKTEDGEDLPLTALSSGEQQEVVLLYELLFKVTPDTLVLIDEPEISLHVAWQKEFINDLLKIVELKKINVIVATHSPQIIDSHWDLVIDLWDLTTASGEEASE